MMRYVGIFCFCFAIGCTSKDSVPSDILPKSEMQKLMWDMVQADQFSKQFLVKDSAKRNVRQETVKLYDEVFQLHHITRDEFEKSYQFYIGRPDIFKIIMDSVSAEANRHQQEAHQSVPPPSPQKPKPIEQPVNKIKPIAPIIKK